jgi:tripartite-type tricarboxylate transporter receptor subunit TctC
VRSRPWRPGRERVSRALSIARLAQLFAAGAGILSGCVDVASAQSGVEHFYAGKNVSVIIGFGVGGGYDTYARLLSRHMGRHLPGNPVFVPQSMPGAGSIKAANYIYAVAPKDGTTIGTFGEFLTIAPLLGTLALDAQKFTWIGSIRKETKTCVFSTSSPIASWSDMLTKVHRVGGQARGSEIDLITNVFRSLFHTKSELVTGYNGQREVMLAMERGEVDGGCGQSYESFTTIFADLFQRNVAKMVVYASPWSLPGLKDVPNAFDLATTAEQKAILNFIFGTSIMSRAFAAPPDIPAERKLALRKAFDDTMTDPQFLADAAQQKLEVAPTRGSEIETLIGDIYATPKAITDRAAEIAKMP